MARTEDIVDYRLLNSLSHMVLCSHCFKRGEVTPVPQVISVRHRIRNLCSDCSEKAMPKRGENSPTRQRLIARYLKRKTD